MISQFDSLKRVHIIGVCGTLMGAFAAFLKRKGLSVSGSDQNIYPPMSELLKTAGVELHLGYRRENLFSVTSGSINKPDLVVIGNVIRANNPEAQAAMNEGLTYASLPEAMENLFLQTTRNLVVAGTHGKTTTSSLLAHTLVSAGKKPSYFIGGISQDLPVSFHIEPGMEEGRGGLFVLEGDEYDTAFWDKVPKFNHYCPDDVILTSVEYDHADIYPDFAACERAFEGLISRIRTKGRLIACFEYESVRKLARRAQVPILSYASRAGEGVQFTPGNVRFEEGITRFEVLDQGTPVGEVSLQIPGMHNVLNALSVWILSRCHGLSSDQVAQAMKSFRGVKRRQELLGEFRGVMVIDDFAHHPTAVRETLRALRTKYPKRRLVAVFEPRSATSRRKIFQNDYVTALSLADATYISSPYDQSEISVDQQFSSETLAADLSKNGKTAQVFKTIGLGVLSVAESSRSNDLVAVLSNGGFGGFITKLIEELSR
ncbi:unnamed protein product [Sphagnum tenellum]